MTMNNATRVCLICIVLSLVSGWVQAAGRTLTGSWRYPVGGSMQAATPRAGLVSVGDFPSQSFQYAGRRYTQPVAAWPGQYERRSNAGVSEGTDAWVEQTLSEAALAVYQSLVVTVSVVSDRNLKTIKPILPHTEGVVWEKLEGPVTTLRQGKGQSQIVNTYRFVLTPIIPGTLSLEPIRFTGTLAGSRWSGRGGSGPAFDVSARQAVALSVSPADPSVQPWLPLHDLKIRSDISHAGLSEGKPLTVKVSMMARGMSGDRLPSLESQLQGKGYQVYRESVFTEQALADDGRTLVGTRIETYTVLPRHGGELELPEISVAWWNVDTGLAETAVLPPRNMYVSGAMLRGGTESTLPSLWVPFLIIVFGVSIYWAWLWAGRNAVGRRMRGAVRRPVARVTRRIGGAVRDVTAWVSPVRIGHHLRAWTLKLVPRQMRLWYCLRCLEDEDNPSEWCQLFKFMACKNLEISEQVTLRNALQTVAEENPGADPRAIQTLARTLDEAVYGGSDVDFRRWKLDLKKQVRPRLLGRRQGGTGREAPRLPALNPGDPSAA